MHNFQKLTAVIMLLATALLGVACSEREEGAGSEPVDQASEAYHGCKDCGDAWYCDLEGKLVHQKPIGGGGCQTTEVLNCPHGCTAFDDCAQHDTCY
jgi:hypothetical protein